MGAEGYAAPPGGAAAPGWNTDRWAAWAESSLVAALLRDGAGANSDREADGP